MRSTGTMVVLFLGVFGLKCDRSEAPAPHVHGRAPSESSSAGNLVRLSDSASELVGIKLEKAKSRECRSVLKAMGKVLAPQPQKAVVSHAFSGRVAEIHVKIGEWVDEGQALLTLESHEIGSAKSEFYKALADLELAKLNLEREERLLEEGIGLKKNYLAAEAAHKIAQSNAEAAHKKLHVLGFNDEQVQEIADTHQINPSITLFSPIAGRVVTHRAVLGAVVDPSTELLTIIDPTRLWVDAEVYEKDIAKVRIGQEVEIGVPAYPAEVFRGKISYIGDVVDGETRTITVRSEVDNQQQRLKPGMFADVNVLLNGRCELLVVPSAAILEEGREKIVFVKEQDHFVRREVETGIIDGDYQQIVKGLGPGDEVVVEGNHELKSKLQEEVLETAHVH